MAVGPHQGRPADDALGRQRDAALDGSPHRLGGFERIPCDRGRGVADRRALRAQGQGREADRPRRRRAKDFVAWIYADPVGPEHNTLNCSISDLELDVEIDGGQPPSGSTVSGAAAYEFGTRDIDHGIPLQPYPDG